MCIKEFVDSIKDNLPVTVKIVNSKLLFEDSYAENGMIGKIISIGVRKDQEDDSYWCYRILINWNDFEDINREFESHDWYIGKGTEELGTMKEAGMYPKDGLEDYYIDYDIESPFEIYGENGIVIKYLNMYNEENTENITFTEWLCKKLDKKE